MPINPSEKTCVKCSGKDIDGPRWTGDANHIELFKKDKLEYRCKNCGYSWTDTCADKVST